MFIHVFAHFVKSHLRDFVAFEFISICESLA